MADKPTPDEDLPPRKRFERLVKGPEPEVFSSAHPPAEELEEVDEDANPPQYQPDTDSTEPPQPHSEEGTVLERFDALKQRLARAGAAPDPPDASETMPNPSETKPIEPAARPPVDQAAAVADRSLDELDAQIQSARSAERELAAEVEDESPTGRTPEPDTPTYDELEQIKLDEAAERRRAARKAKRKERRKNRSFWKELPILIVISVVVAIVIKTFFFQAFYIPSASMVPSLEVNDRVLVNKLSYQFGAIERGDILVFDSPEAVEVERSLFQRVVRRVGEATGLVSPDTVLIKRVVALPGQTIAVRDNQVYINDSPIAEPYLSDGVTTRDFEAVTVPVDHVFMMGDNRNSSRDSRIFGPIHKDDVVGRAFVRVWPASRWSGL